MKAIAKFAVGSVLAAALSLAGSPYASADSKYEEEFVQKFGKRICVDLSQDSGQRTFWTIHSFYLSELGNAMNYDDIQHAMGTSVARYCPQYYDEYEYYLSIYNW